ncbi:MAG: hypothetical protein NC419_06460 [Muribaculaceae bacterium]|nr:hypothetical protein [Muribaculaceae bacterium]
MTTNNKKTAFRLLLLIATPKLVGKAAELLKQGNVPVQYMFHAQGTASSEVMDMLGLDGIDKNVLMCMIPKFYADELLQKLRRKLHLGMPNTGIAFTIKMSGSSGYLLQLMEEVQTEEKPKHAEKEHLPMTGNEYYMIMAIVNQGYSWEVMEAARPEGASGGTVFHSRRIGSEETMKFWKISVQEEREVVLILAGKEDKLTIMQAISKRCGINTEAQGIILSLPVDTIVGLD